MSEYRFYGKYRNVRNAVWQVLVDYGITALPVSVMKLAKTIGIEVVTYSDGVEIIELLELTHLCKKNNGFSAYVQATGEWYIFFDENMKPKTRIRFTLAHELGHILLGHELKLQEGVNNTVGYTEENIFKERKKPIETEADMFALRLLSPACVLWGLSIMEAEDIMTLCGICLKEARQRAKRMEELYSRDKFLTDQLERQVFEQFKGFIEEQRMSY